MLHWEVREDRGRCRMPDYSESLRLLVEKFLIRRGMRSASCRVFAPMRGGRTYSVVLEESTVREQFYIDSAHVDQFVETGNDQHVLTDIRSGYHNLERMLMKKKAGRER